jgi:hypothetical protein
MISGKLKEDERDKMKVTSGEARTIFWTCKHSGFHLSLSTCPSHLPGSGFALAKLAVPKFRADERRRLTSFLALTSADHGIF